MEFLPGFAGLGKGRHSTTSSEVTEGEPLSEGMWAAIAGALTDLHGRAPDPIRSDFDWLFEWRSIQASPEDESRWEGVCKTTTIRVPAPLPPHSLVATSGIPAAALEGTTVEDIVARSARDISFWGWTTPDLLGERAIVEARILESESSWFPAPLTAEIHALLGA